jgi:NodT family efflux transporter outer membrane factor (OMF) lipoprotein
MAPEVVSPLEDTSTGGIIGGIAPSRLCQRTLAGLRGAGDRAMIKRFILLLTASLGLSGCIADIQPHVAPVSEAGLGLGPAAPPIQANWWTAYHDHQLDRLIEIGLSENPTLDAALARVENARAQLQLSESKLSPQINGGTQVNPSLLGDKLLPPPIGGTAATLFQAGLSLGWDLDLFGRQHALVRSAAERADASAFDTAAAKLAVSVSIAQTYVNLAQATKQIKVINGIVATRQESLALVKSRGRADLAGDLEVQTNETLVAQAEQAITRASRDRDTLVHALAALVGRGADFYAQVREPSLSLERAPQVPKVIPANLLGRRPDLLAAHARIDAALDGREAAAASFLPDISVTALAGAAAFGASNFFAPGSGYYLVGPALSLPIFDGGRLRAQYKETTADLDAAVADYNNAVLKAVREAADAVTNVRAADKDMVQQLRVVTGLRNVVKLSKDRVATGLNSNLDAIDSGFRLLDAERDLVHLRANALITRIQLIAALGGGFSPHAPVVALGKEK